MKKFACVLLGLCLMVLSGCGPTVEGFTKQGYLFTPNQKVAVIDVTGEVGSEAVKNQIADKNDQASRFYPLRHGMKNIAGNSASGGLNG